MRPLHAELCTQREVLHDLQQDDPRSAFGGLYCDTDCSSDLESNDSQPGVAQRQAAAQQVFVRRV